MKYSFICFLCVFLFTQCSNSVESIPEGKEEPIKEAGKIQNVSQFISFNEGKLDTIQLGTLELKKGSGEVYKSLTDVIGISLLDVVEAVNLEGLDNKSYSSFLVACRAEDGYQTLYSWNELFNSENGEKMYLIIYYNGESFQESEDGIMMVSLMDKINGRRNLRGLAEIQILNLQRKG